MCKNSRNKITTGVGQNDVLKMKSQSVTDLADFIYISHISPKFQGAVPDYSLFLLINKNRLGENL